MKLKNGKIEVKKFEFSKKKRNCNLELLTMKVKKIYHAEGTLDFIFDQN